MEEEQGEAAAEEAVEDGNNLPSEIIRYQKDSWYNEIAFKGQSNFNHNNQLKYERLYRKHRKTYARKR